VLAAAQDVLRPVIGRLPVADRSAIVQGYAGVYSSFLLHAERAAVRYAVPAHEILQKLDPPVRDSWAAMFPAPRQRWVDDLALSGAELAGVRQPVLLVHGRDDQVVPWMASTARLIDILPDNRAHILSNCGHWTMIERTADFLAVVGSFLG
jgi:pimeloyl-ACP methyl ester carboxylesterase